MDFIEITGARAHNLKAIDLKIPRNKLVVVTGVSGSGKSSLVFDTLYTEAQRQLIETFSTFARRRLPKLSRPDVDNIQNLSTAIIIDQKRLGRTLRSTVGTATDIYTYLRLLYSRCGTPIIGGSFLFSFNHPEGMCPQCNGLGTQINIDQQRLLRMDLSLKAGAIDHPEYKVGGWNWRQIVESKLFDPGLPLADYTQTQLENLLYTKKLSIKRESAGAEYTHHFEGVVTKLERLFCAKEEVENPGSKKDAYSSYLIYSDCVECGGSRLNNKALSVSVHGSSIHDLAQLELSDLSEFLDEITDDIALPLVRKIRRILTNLIDTGVGYLSLSRNVATLSGGESQRVKMARQLDCDLVGLLYILDEPTIGLHPRDTDRCIQLLKRLRDHGNSVILVEHDPDMMQAADHLIDIGPSAGRDGGHLCFDGSFDQFRGSSCKTAQMLRKRPVINPSPRKPRQWLEIQNATTHNLQNLNVRFPMGILLGISGVAGSGKSTLIHDELVPRLDSGIIINQKPVGRSSRSNPLTYSGAFDLIRKWFARKTGSTPGMFSFNSNGACPHCKGLGAKRLEMNFLDDILITCTDCDGKRYLPEVLELKVNDHNISDILRMTVQEALEFFADSKIMMKLQMLDRVGLGYLELGQSLSSLSGGEAQRLKLARELEKSDNIYILDEPTTGLHMGDVERLMIILQDLVDSGNSVIVIEHNLDVLAQVDWIIDLGPEGGSSGGQIVVEGPPEKLVNCPRSYTGQYLQKLVEKE